jgi:preprotein translocase subunit YajC
MNQIVLQTGNAGGWSQMLPLILIMAVFYVFMIMPQMRKQKKQRNFLSEIKKGDHVVTTGGMHGKVVSIQDQTITLETESGNRMKFEKAAVSFEMTQSSYPASDKAEKTEKSEEK